MNNDNKGSLFKNDRKEKDTHPDYTGNITVEGKEYWINAWLNEAKSGVKYLGLSVNPKEAKKEQQSSNNQPAIDDEIIF